MAEVESFPKYPEPLSDLEPGEITFTTPDVSSVPKMCVLKDVKRMGANSKLRKAMRWLQADGELMLRAPSHAPSCFSTPTASSSPPLVSLPSMTFMLAPTAALRSPRRTLLQQTIPVRRVSSYRERYGYLNLTRYGLEAKYYKAKITFSGADPTARWSHRPTTLRHRMRLAGMQNLSLQLFEVNAANVGDYQCCCLRPNLTKGVANWPGVEGQNQQSARQEVPLPYETEVGMKEELMEGPVCQGAVRQLNSDLTLLNGNYPRLLLRRFNWSVIHGKKALELLRWPEKTSLLRNDS
ncbi:hypothetical protein EGR_10488 [Echinococcus granulosus]|uniref:Uncharacterized protein n=1 Tax=Echinococcus granulosus TaxID=6210 RepID=W6U8B0_ECHGR|nr:hypothetical protein EGR_10488 [Echinococcus granulosus]EUB54652.1 hypothetical protein EGR_10488 [Echinococcus granulosus]